MCVKVAHNFNFNHINMEKNEELEKPIQPPKPVDIPPLKPQL